MTYEDMLAAKIDKILEDLREHFDAVQFLGTFEDEEGNTGLLSMGKGNWYARQGAAREFLNKDSTATTAHELGKILPRQDDDGEDWKE